MELVLGTFLAFKLRLPIQTPLFVAPKLQECLRSGIKCENFRKTSTPLVQQWFFLQGSVPNVPLILRSDSLNIS